MREIILDIETTGLNFKTGDRVIEVGCVELFNHTPSGNNLQFYCSKQLLSSNHFISLVQCDGCIDATIANSLSLLISGVVNI